jgi:hypothetical protein
MHELSRGFLGALVGMAAGLLLSIAWRPEVNEWWMPTGTLYTIASFYPALHTFAALHGAICGLIIGFSGKGTEFGVMAGLALAFLFYLAYVLYSAIVMFANALAFGSGPFYEVNTLYGIVQTALVAVAYSLPVLVFLAIPSLVHSVVIASLTKIVISRSRLSDRHWR